MLELKTKKEYISFLNVVSTIAVVFLHTNGCFWQFSNSRYWVTANIIESIFYFAVPLFFMISGVTLINYHKKYDTKTFFKKRLMKTVLPFLVWSIIALLYRIYYSKSIIPSQLNFKFVLNGIFGTSFLSIYWFFIPLFIIYLIIPILSSIDAKKQDKVFWYIIILSFVLNSALPLINNIFKLDLNLPIKLIVGTEYVMYVLLGYLLDKKELSKKNKIIIYILGLIGLLVHIIMTYNLSIEANKTITLYKGYNNVPCVIYSIAIFVLLKSIFNYLKNKKFKSMINWISGYCFAIYLMHFFIMQILNRAFKLDTISILYHLGMPFIIIPICMIITWILRKIPIVKYIVP